MKKHNRELFCMPVLIGMLVCALACKSDSRQELTIAVSANMQYAMEELVGTFTQETGIPCELIFGSSGKLTAQIIEGAPFDLFLSADMKYPKEIFEKGMASSTPNVYAYGYLVIWSRDSTLDLSVQGLLSDRVRHLAIANPETAPYGAAALSFLRESGILDQVESKLVYGESIAQTNQFILSGSAEAGITARSVVSAEAAAGIGHWIEADRNLYQPIAQGVVVLDRVGSKKDRAFAFTEFLRSPSAREILHKFGYGLEGSQ